MSLLPPWREDQAKLERSLAGACPKGRSRRQTKGGASGSELLTSRKHVPDRVGEAAGDVDLGDLGAALFAESALVALVALRVSGHGFRRPAHEHQLDKCPLQARPSARATGLEPATSGVTGKWAARHRAVAVRSSSGLLTSVSYGTRP